MGDSCEKLSVESPKVINITRTIYKCDKKFPEPPKESDRFEIITDSEYNFNCGSSCDAVTLLNGDTMCVHKKGEYVSDQIRNSKTGYCELSTMEILLDIIQKHVKKDDKEDENAFRALDIGANIGSCSLYWAKRGFKIYAFEPVHRNLECFRRSIAINGYEKQIKLFPYALGETEEYVNIDIEKNNFGNSVIGSKEILPGMFYKNKKFNYSEIVHVIPLDGLVKEHINVAKIDTQGHELAVITGGKNFFKEYSIDVILSEFAPQFMRSKGDEPVDYLMKLHANRYKLWDIKNFSKYRKGETINDFEDNVDTTRSKFQSYVTNLRTGFSDLVCIKEGISI